MAQTTKKTASTKSNAPALAYRAMQKPHATSYAGENDELTISHNAGLVAIINPQTKKKTIAVTVGTETTGLRKDGTPWIRHKNVILPVDTLETLIASLQAALTTVQKHNIKAGVVYSASAVDLAFISQNHAEPEAEPVAQTSTKAAGKNSAPAAAAAKQAKAEPETQAMTVAGWLAENAAEYKEPAEFIEHIMDNEAGYQGKAVLRQAYNLLAEKFGKDKLQGQPALETVAQHIAAVFFKPKAKPAAKPEVQAAKPAVKPAAVKPAAAKPAVVNAAELLEDEDEDEDLGTQLPDFDLADVDLII